MRRALVIVLLCAGAAVMLPLRSAAQGGEVFGGYSYLRSNTGSGANASGWEGSLTGNFNRFFGLEVSLSDHYKKPGAGEGFSNEFSFLFGPHFAFRAVPKATPFVHALVGGTRGTQTMSSACPLGGSNLCPIGGPCPPCPTPRPQHQTAFTTAVGGGLDVQAGRFVAIRVIQADYLREQFTGNPQNDVRFSFGIVLRFTR
ncbi:MAG TPA: hypothetical protein VGZ29_08415 [Terriglobia bacterium]|nr:hypothetical protein [Terriglobia bacterium]